MKVTNVQWDFDMDEVYERLDSMSEKAAADALEVALSDYSRMSVLERHDLAEHLFHHCPAKLDEFVGLPDEIEVPDPITSAYSDPEELEEVISDWLSEEFGYCHSGFEVKAE